MRSRMQAIAALLAGLVIALGAAEGTLWP